MKCEDSPAAKLHALAADVVREQAHWIDIKKNGCNDPFWSDGVNMNLTRRHILHDKEVIAGICSETGLSFPEEYYIPTPPEVDSNYMANLKQKERVARIKAFGRTVTKKCPAYCPQQMSLI